MSTSTIRIKLKSFDHILVDISARDIIEVARKTGAQVKGPILLPVTTERITVLSGPHIYKTARDQFELKTYKRLIDIFDPTDGTVEALVKLELAAGVDVKISLK